MKSLKEWQLQQEYVGENPNWKALRQIWHGNQQMADNSQLRSMRVKVEALKEQYAKENGFESWAQVPMAQIHAFAEQLTTTVLKAVYGQEAGSGRAVNATKLSQLNTQPQSPLPQDAVEAPANWKG